MKRKVPKKNISRRIADVRKPFKKEGAEHIEIPAEEDINPELAAKIFGEHSPETADQDNQDWNKLGSVSPPAFSVKKLVGVFLIAAVIVSGLTFYFYQKWIQSLNSFASSWRKLESIGNQNVPQPPAEQDRQNSLGIPDIGKLWSALKIAAGSYKSLQSWSIAALDLTQEISLLQNNWLNFVLSQQGDQLIAILEKIKADLALINEAGSQLTSSDSGLKNFFTVDQSSLLTLQIGLNRWQKFLSDLLVWLKSSNERHILVLFQNSSEMRPAGGFLGSYTELTMQNAGIQKIEVHDINDADREFDVKIVPPQPLQSIANSWRVADANWFFDYSLSAGKIIQFMEATKKYKTQGISFDAALAVSPKVVADLLTLTGPVELPAHKLSVNKDNFLIEIQKEVQINQAKKQPAKKILEELAPLLLQKIAAFSNAQKNDVLNLSRDWLAEKDLMFYFKDQNLEKFFDFYNLTGKVFELPKNFNGDYLAVVNANIGGAKSDLFIRQKIFYQSRLNPDGTLNTHLVIEREHQGNKSSYWWYRAVNENYLTIFTAPMSQLTDFSGGWDRKIYPQVNYSKSGYAVDTLLSEIESQAKNDFNYPLVKVFQESGKNVFAVWTRTKAGQTSKIIFDYTNHLFSLPNDGQTYQFTFEKQAGAEAEYQLEINAPLGYKWRENNLPIFEYQTNSLPGRLILNLTLVKT